MTNPKRSFNREMFYDMYMRGLERNLDCLEDPHPRLINLEPVLEDAKIFYIDDLVKDSLINSQFNFADNDPGLNKLPFPSMFFEFESGLEYRTLEGKISDSFFINSLLFTPLRRNLTVNPESNLFSKEDWDLGGFSVYTFGNLKEENIASGPYHEAHFFYNTKNLILSETDLHPRNTDGKFRIQMALKNLGDHEHAKNFLKTFKRELDEATEPPKGFIEDEYLDAQKMPNLAINLIDYIRAENVVITPKKRVLKSKCDRSPKELKPYHLIEIKKQVYPKREDAQEDLWEIDCRFWVMGHNHKYHTSKGIITNWIEAYIKGPENAPWKNNRYLMLYKNFRDRLDRRGNEEIGTSLED